MKIDKNCKIEKCVATEKTRGPIQFVYVHRTDEKDPSTGSAVATDGRRIVIVPVQFEDGDTDSFLTADMLKQARKADKNDVATLGVNGCIKLSNGVVLPKSDNEQNYPNYRQVIPNGEVKFSVAFNAHFLSEIADAIGSKSGIVNLEFGDDNLTAIRVSGGVKGALGILMPARMS